MKKNLFLFFMTLAIYLQAQSYHPFPIHFGSWNYQYYDEFHNPTGQFNSIILIGDTVIAGTNYKKINSFGTFYSGALREQNKIIYFVPKDSTNEAVLYNFNLNLGDTLFNAFGQNVCHTDTMIVVHVDSVPTSTSYARQLDFSCSATWIEGVGSINYFLNPSLAHPISGSYVLDCMVGDTGVFYTNGSTNCITSVSENVIEKTILAITPNPFHSSAMFEISAEFENSELIIYNEIGIQVKKIAIHNKSTMIDRGRLQAGIYLYQVINNKGKKTSGKFVIE